MIAVIIKNDISEHKIGFMFVFKTHIVVIKIEKIAEMISIIKLVIFWLTFVLTIINDDNIINMNEIINLHYLYKKITNRQT